MLDAGPTAAASHEAAAALWALPGYWLIDLLDDAGIVTRRQVDLGGEHWIGRVDLKVVDAALVVEAPLG